MQPTTSISSITPPLPYLGLVGLRWPGLDILPQLLPAGLYGHQHFVLSPGSKNHKAGNLFSDIENLNCPSKSSFFISNPFLLSRIRSIQRENIVIVKKFELEILTNLHVLDLPESE
ncbi:hypothetical protein AVEN_46115-1 [Araneus ventricosus]|uniref:Uncharacterized protein n=1 Tax=Araneus ventricosus TaxID=182803 RepID=A0A4Y2FWY0_ARAVE|nr:hypothetical protein AVEN_46115-1 [Araneus ventricosus]